MNRSNNRSRLYVWLAIVGVVGVIAIALLFLLEVVVFFPRDVVVDPTPGPCEIETAGNRLVYDEPANPDKHIGEIEPGRYRVVAFTLENWVSVDWAEWDLAVNSADLAQLDWLQFEDGADVFLGDCTIVPRLGMRPNQE